MTIIKVRVGESLMLSGFKSKNDAHVAADFLRRNLLLDCEVLEIGEAVTGENEGLLEWVSLVAAAVSEYENRFGEKPANLVVSCGDILGSAKSVFGVPVVTFDVYDGWDLRDGSFVLSASTPGHDARTIRFLSGWKPEPVPSHSAQVIREGTEFNFGFERGRAILPPDAGADAPTAPRPLDLTAHLERQRAWSEKTFGPGARVAGLVEHIGKELEEIKKAPTDLSEWIDVAILAFDGAWRAGYTPEQIVGALVAKQAKNEARTWPDWRTVPEGKAIEHVRDDVPRDADGNEWKVGDECEWNDTNSRWLPGRIGGISEDAIFIHSRDELDRLVFAVKHWQFGKDNDKYLRRPSPAPSPADQPSREERWVRTTFYGLLCNETSMPKWASDYMDEQTERGGRNPAYPASVGDALIRHADGTVTCEKAVRQ